MARDPEEVEADDSLCLYHGSYPADELFCPWCEKSDTERKGE